MNRINNEFFFVSQPKEEDMFNSKISEKGKKGRRGDQFKLLGFYTKGKDLIIPKNVRLEEQQNGISKYIGDEHIFFVKEHDDKFEVEITYKEKDCDFGVVTFFKQ